MQIVLFLVFSLALLVLFSVKKDELSLKSRIGILLGVIVVFLLAGLYEYSKVGGTEQRRIILNAFLQGKTLTCKDIVVSKEHFEYVSGTQTFVPKRENTKDKGIVLEVLECNINN